MSRPAISIEDLGKQYRIGLKKAAYSTLRESIVGALASPVRRFRELSGHSANPTGADTFWALRHVSFDVQPGEVVGIVGRNGAGKSTLLKMLSRITDPTEGMIRLRGRVGSLLEVGTGFHPELTGRENIYLNASILGMRKTEIDRKFDEIVEFSGISRFLDTQVKHYSSGMQVRLGFAVAAHLDPEILIVDEVLAVGDAEFQRRCMGKMQQIASDEGRTILFVSHNMGAIRSLCTRGIYLDQGQLVRTGPINELVEEYLGKLVGMAQQALANRTDRSGLGKIRLRDFYLATPDGKPVDSVFTGSPYWLTFTYESNKPLRNPVFQCAVYTQSGDVLSHFSSDSAAQPVTVLPASGSVRCYVERLPLAPGAYRINTAIYDAEGMQDHLVGAIFLDVAWGDYYQHGRAYELRHNTCVVDCQWHLSDESSAVGSELAQ
jgi:lipopolysaccharide transport system ATP-binding protein